MENLEVTVVRSLLIEVINDELSSISGADSFIENLSKEGSVDGLLRRAANNGIPYTAVIEKLAEFIPIR